MPVGNPVKQPLAQLAARIHGKLWWGRACTVGVRVMAFDANTVLLVRHTYLAGWYLPGGGVGRGESCEAAALRELYEEGGLRCSERPQLHGLFRNGGHDHVACYSVREFTRERAPPSRFKEIEETGFFPLDRLPPDASPATRARLREWREGLAPSLNW